MNNLLKLHHCHPLLHLHPFFSHTLPSISKSSQIPVKLSPSYNAFSASNSFNLKAFKVSNIVPSSWGNEEEQQQQSSNDGCLEDLAFDSPVYQRTLRLVECSMFAAVAGLTYLLSNSLAIENYFGCFFALPIVISSIRWGIAAARKTMVATAVLLLVLSGPVKAITYVLMHGLLGFTMGSLWSEVVTQVVRSVKANHQMPRVMRFLVVGITFMNIYRDQHVEILRQAIRFDPKVVLMTPTQTSESFKFTS